MFVCDSVVYDSDMGHVIRYYVMIVSCETWCILGDGSGIAVMPSVPILVVCITNLTCVRFIYVLDCYGPT